MSKRYLLTLLPALLAAPATAQQEPQDTSHAVRLECVERTIEVLRSQIAEIAAAKVESRSRNRVELSGEVSIGGHDGWLALAVDSLVVSRAAALSVRLSAGCVELRGEALAGLGCRGIGQNLSPGSRPIRTKGGWAQLNLKPASTWELGGGYGLDATVP